MGIPKFFRWLTRRYPMILQNVQRDEDCPPTGKHELSILVSYNTIIQSLFQFSKFELFIIFDVFSIFTLTYHSYLRY